MSEDKPNTPETEIVIEDPGQAIDMVQDTLETFFETADVSKVYGDPIQHEDTFIIPAAEVVAGVGFGAGYGAGPAGKDGEAPSGGGGGGAGKTFARPVAVVIADKNGVRVEPIMDSTKIALTALTAFGFIFGTIAKMKRGR